MPNQLASHSSVVVIGGGIKGCLATYHLAKMGVDDAIPPERNSLTSGITRHSAAQVQALRNSCSLTEMIPHSHQLYSQLEQETSRSAGWIQKGSLLITTTPDRLTEVKGQDALAEAHVIETHSISVSLDQNRGPLTNTDDILGAAWSPEDGRILQSNVWAALGQTGKGLGARIFQKTGATGILTENCRVCFVQTTQGTLMYDEIALCIGPRSREVGAMARSEVPALARERYFLLTKSIARGTENTPALSDHDTQLYIRDDSSGLQVRCFKQMGKAIDPGVLKENFCFDLLPENWDHFEPMMELALKRLQALETAETYCLILGCSMNSVVMTSDSDQANCIVDGHTSNCPSEAYAKRLALVFNSVEQLMSGAPMIFGTYCDVPYSRTQLKTKRNLRAMPMDAEYCAASAHMGLLHGWGRPLYFSKTAKPILHFHEADWFERLGAELRAVPENIANIDASPFGKISVLGPDSETFLMRICLGHMNRAPGDTVDTTMLDDHSTLEADLTAQRIAADQHRLLVETTLIKRDQPRLRRQAEGVDVILSERTEDCVVLGLIGSEAARIMAECGAPELNALSDLHQSGTHVAGKYVRAAREPNVAEVG